MRCNLQNARTRELSVSTVQQHSRWDHFPARPGAGPCNSTKVTHLEALAEGVVAFGVSLEVGCRLDVVARLVLRRQTAAATTSAA